MNYLLSGIFTPTLNGTYLLSVHVKGYQNNGDIVIQRNGADILCRTWLVNGPNLDPTSCTAAAHLSAGDAVQVMAGTTQQVGISGNYRHFSGLLVHLD